jgi:prepilin-type N-terminal cleavage/methylation domain-containing protein
MGDFKSNKGFTLLELLIYIGILAIVMVVLTTTITSINKGIGQISASGEVDSNVRFVLNKVGQDVNYASVVTNPSDAGSASSTLTITSNSGASVSYCLVNGVIYRKAGGSCTSGSEPITSTTVNVTSLQFTNIQNTSSILGVVFKTVVSIQMVITVRYNSSSPDWQYSQTNQTTFQLNS